MLPVIKTLPETKLAGKHLTMSFADNKTAELWRSFMPAKKEIKNISGTALYSVEVYNDTNIFTQFSPARTFEKWAAIAVTDYDQLTQGMDALTLPSGLYAVFIHKGPASDGPKTYQYIFTQWLPASEYTIDDRPHFALMSEKYRNDSPDSEEEIWIPVKRK